MALLDSITASRPGQAAPALAARRGDRRRLAQCDRPVGRRPLRRCSACGATRRIGAYGAARRRLRPRSRCSAYACQDGSYPSRSAPPSAGRPARARHPRPLRPAMPTGAPDTRPWLDHGFWERAPPARQPRQRRASAKPYAFLPVEGEGLHQIPVGPVHAGIIEPGHFRFTGNGETVVRLEERLGYVHKGIESLMAGATLDAARQARRRAPPATARSPMPLPSRAPSRRAATSPCRRARRYLRALMAELERLANHFGDIGAICNDASFALMHRALRHPARARAAHGGGLLRPPADDGPRSCRAASRATSTDAGVAQVRRPARRNPPRASRAWSSSTTTPPRCRTAPSPPAS